jgi:uncharacterized oligopeptide transporter (OPT) family protein
LPRELTARALVVGAGIGLVLAAGNVYTGLKTSFIDGGSITAALLGFTLFATVRRLARTPYSSLENNITQTAASSAAVMGFSLGLPGPVAALGLMGHSLPAWALAAWGVAMGVIGIFVAAALRQKLIVIDALPFPTGGATAELIETMYTGRAQALERARLLLAAAVGAMAVTWFRDGRPQLIPQVTLFGATVAGVSTAALTLGVSWSPLMLSTGVMIGVRNAASMLAGATLSWAVVVPRLVRSGVVAPGYVPAVSWLVWPAVGLLLAGSFVPLLLDWRALVRSFRDLGALVRSRANGDGLGPAGGARLFKGVLAAAVAVMLALGWFVFRLNPGVTVLVLLLAVVLAAVAARAAGETDIGPVGPLGMIAQLAFARQGPKGSLLTGAIVSGESSQTAQMLWAFKAGHRLGASPRAQMWAQMLGAVLGAVVVVPVYLVIVRSYGLGTEAMPAPAALSWKATAEAVRDGIANTPRHAPLACLIGLAVGTALALLARTRAGRLLPSPAAMGTAALMPASLSTTIFLGAIATLGFRRLRPQASDAAIMSFAAGGIAGESVMGVVVAALIASGVF